MNNIFKIIIFLLIVLLLFLGFKYYNYRIERNFINNSSSKLISEHFNFNYFFSKWYESNGQLPNEEEVKKYLDQLIFNKKDLKYYDVKVDSLSNSVEVYRKSNINNKEPFCNLITINSNEDHDTKFDFYNYLLCNELNLLVFESSYKYNCNNNNIFVTEKNRFVVNDLKLESKMEGVLKAFDLRLLSRKDTKKGAIFLYSQDQDTITIKCDNYLSNGLTKEDLAELKRSLKLSYPSYPKIKFSVSN